MKKDIYYLSMEGITSTVFQSQVYELLNSDISNENNVTLILMQPINIKWHNNIRRILELLREKNFSVKIIPYIGFRGRLSLMNAFWGVFLVVSVSMLNNNIKIIHCRAQEATVLAIKLKKIFKKIKIISDIRGVPTEELSIINKKRATYFDELDKYIFKGNLAYIDSFNFVSRVLEEYYIEKYDIKNINSTNIPCFASFDFKLVESEELEEVLNVLYVGGQQFYQRINDIPNLVSKIKGRKIKLFICLSGAINEEIEDKIKEYNIEYEIYYNLNKFELNKIYSLCHIGVLIRDNTNLNKVASPVKLSEYLSKGLYLIIVGEVGDFYNYVKDDKKLGVVYKELEDVKEINLENNREVHNKKYRIIFSNKFSKNYCVNKYRSIYKGV